METITNQLAGQIEDQEAIKSANLIQSKRDCMISYLVKYQITRFTNGNPSVISKQKKFREPNAIDARKKAFQYAKEIYELSKIDGKLCDEHISSEYEAALSLRKNCTVLKVTVYFSNEYYINDQKQISGTQPYNGYEDFVQKLKEECRLYRHYNYDMGGVPMNVTINEYCNYDILNMSTTGVCDKMYYISRFTSKKQVIEKQIRVNRKNPIILFPTNQLTDNLALELFEEECPYVLFEVSVLGISSIFNIVNYGSCTYKDVFGYRLQQQSIPPEFINRIEIRNTSDRTHYEDFAKKDENIDKAKKKSWIIERIQRSFKFQREPWLNLENNVENFINENNYLWGYDESSFRNIVNEQFQKWYNALNPKDRKEFDVKRSTSRFDL